MTSSTGVVYQGAIALFYGAYDGLQGEFSFFNWKTACARCVHWEIKENPATTDVSKLHCTSRSQGLADVSVEVSRMVRWHTLIRWDVRKQVALIRKLAAYDHLHASASPTLNRP